MDLRLSEDSISTEQMELSVYYDHSNTVVIHQPTAVPKKKRKKKTPIPKSRFPPPTSPNYNRKSRSLPPTSQTAILTLDLVHLIGQPKISKSTQKRKPCMIFLKSKNDHRKQAWGAWGRRGVR
jgi:hypothetical protein